MLYVKNLEKSGKWYSNTLGFTIGNYDYNVFVELTIEDQYVMHLFKVENQRPFERAAFSFGTNDIKAAQFSLKEKGIEVTDIRECGDHSEFTFKDLDGNTLMVCQYRN